MGGSGGWSVACESWQIGGSCKDSMVMMMTTTMLLLLHKRNNFYLYILFLSPFLSMSLFSTIMQYCSFLSMDAYKFPSTCMCIYLQVCVCVLGGINTWLGYDDMDCKSPSKLCLVLFF